MTRSEILGLSKMSGAEAQNVLIANGIIHMTDIRYDYGVVRRAESLADLADRLWREGGNGYPSRETQKSMRIVYFLHHPDIDEVSLDTLVFWFLFDSLPIHRIQAALLAKESPK